MEVRTFTSFWDLEKKLYSIYDFQMPVPISLRVIGVFIGTGIPWWVLLSILNVSLGAPWYLLYVLPPGLFAWLGGKPIFEGKTLFQYIRSRVSYLFENKNYKRLEPDLNKYNIIVEVEQRIITQAPIKARPF